MNKKIIIFFFSFLLLFPLATCLAAGPKNHSFYEEGIIENIQESVQKNGQQVTSQQKIKVKILSGPLKGKTYYIFNTPSNNPLSLKIKVGDKVLLYAEKDGKKYDVQIQGFYILPDLLLLLFLFLALIAIIGGKQGIKTIFSLLLASVLIFKFFVDGILSHHNPILLAVLISSLITIFTFIFISGFNKKSLSAILGTVSGVVMAALIAWFFGNLTHLNGLASENARNLLYDGVSLNFKGILFAGIILGALGAVMDVAMSVASTIAEIKKAQPNIDQKGLIKGGMAVGKDIMGTMSNTLIFAYVGSSLFLLLLFKQSGESYLKFLNFNFVGEEVVRSLAGSIGLILTIPLTAFIAAYLETHFSRKKIKK